jgi:hypothetical protein
MGLKGGSGIGIGMEMRREGGCDGGRTWLKVYQKM